MELPPVVQAVLKKTVERAGSLSARRGRPLQDLRRGELVRLRHLAKTPFAHLEGCLAAVMQEADQRGQLKVRQLAPKGLRLSLTAHFLSACFTVTVPRDRHLERGDAVRLPDGRTGRVLSAAQGELLVHLDLDARVQPAEARSCSLLDPEFETALASGRLFCAPNAKLLFLYQSLCVDFVDARRRSLALLPTGAGKTLVALCWCCRLFAQRAREEVYVVLVPNQALLMWNEELPKLVHARVREAIVLVSYEAFASQAKLHYDEAQRTWRGRPVAAAVLDEVHKLRNNGDRARAVASFLSATDRVLGMTATLISTELRQVVNECQLLGLGEPYESKAFWEAPEALRAARLRGDSPVFWLEEEAMRAEVSMQGVAFPSAIFLEQEYASTVDVAGLDLCKRLPFALAELFGVSLEHAALLRDENDEAFAARCAALLATEALPPKPRALLSALDELLGAGHGKVVVSFEFCRTGCALEVLLRSRYAGSVYRFFGTGMAQECRRRELRAFLEARAPCVLLLAHRVGCEAINIVNGALSPGALVEFELTDSWLSETQLLGRLTRCGGGKEVRVLRLLGAGTVNGRQWSFLQRHRGAHERLGLSDATSPASRERPAAPGGPDDEASPHRRRAPAAPRAVDLEPIPRAVAMPSRKRPAEPQDAEASLRRRAVVRSVDVDSRCAVAS